MNNTLSQYFKQKYVNDAELNLKIPHLSGGPGLTEVQPAKGSPAILLLDTFILRCHVYMHASFLFSF